MTHSHIGGRSEAQHGLHISTSSPPPPPPPQPQPTAVAEADILRGGGGGWLSRGHYFRDKRRKLRDQFRESNNYELASSSETSHLFQNLVFHIDGRTSHHTAQELQYIIFRNGGQYEQYYFAGSGGSSVVTHIIATNLAAAKVKQYRSMRNPPFIVHPQWILDSVKLGSLQPEVQYQLPVMRDDTQKTLPVRVTKPNVQPGTDNKISELDCKEQKQDSVPISRTSAVAQPRRPRLFIVRKNSSKPQSENQAQRQPNPHTNASKPLTALTDENFIENYLAQSRLHFIGSWKHRLNNVRQQQHTEQRRERNNDVYKKRYIVHIDMDCFFASVAMREKPHWRTMPLAVAHSRGNHGEISSCNYVARKFGVKGGMWIKQARQLCPDLIIAPYEFDKYEETAEKMFDILFSNCNRVQVMSIDEALIDVSDLCENDHDVQSLVQKMRNEIESVTGCTASAGIAENIMLARIATKRAKPNGQFLISDSSSGEAQDILRGLNVDELPGVGYRMRKQLAEKLGVQFVGDLQRYPRQRLQELFGEKRGTQLFNFCRGIDERQLELDASRKSIGVDINWAIRFETLEQVYEFLDKLGHALGKKMVEECILGKTITLKLKQRREGVGEATKYLGHGVCDDKSKSTTLVTATNDSLLIARQCRRLYEDLGIPAKELRGVGIQMTRLISVNDRNNAQQSTTLTQYFNPSEDGNLNTSCQTTKRLVDKDGRGSAIDIISCSDHKDIENIALGDITNHVLVSNKNSRTSKSRKTTRSSTAKSRKNQKTSLAITDLSSQIDPDTFQELPSEIQSEVR